MRQSCACVLQYDSERRSSEKRTTRERPGAKLTLAKPLSHLGGWRT
jgi:hypothetical protein